MFVFFINFHFKIFIYRPCKVVFGFRKIILLLMMILLC